MKKIRFFIPIVFFCTVRLLGQTPTPVPVQISEQIVNIDGAYYHLHTVEKGQTLYSISRTYQVTIEEIKRTIDKPDIQVDETLMIPVSSKRLKTLKKQHLLPEETSEIDVPKTEPEKADTFIQKTFSNPPKSVLNVALMLPLYLNEVNQIKLNPRDHKTTVKSFSFISFYEGAVLATQAFNAKDIKINVNVFDVTEDENTAVRLVNSGKLKDADMIVGPLFSRSFKVMSDYAKQQEIFIINPLSERDNILIDNPYVIKITPSEKVQLQSLLRYVTKDEGIKQRILIVSDDSFPNEKERSEQAKLFFETYCSHLPPPVFVDISKDKFQNFSVLLSDTKRNAIVYLSNNQIFVTEILSQVSKRENSFDDVLYCLQRLPQFDLTEIQYLNDLQTHYTSSFFVDYDNERVKKFERLFFATYHTIPDNNAYIGYNVMSYVLAVLSAGNTNYGNYLETLTGKDFPNRIRLQRADPSQGLENHETNILKIETSHIKKVNH